MPSVAPTAEVDPRSILFVTLDSCRYDTFERSSTPNIDAIGPLHRAMAPGNFTYSSHAAMFVGFTPGVPGAGVPWSDPKFARIFKLAGAGHPGKGGEFVLLEGRSVMDGLRRVGYRTIGTGAVGWFSPDSPTGKLLVGDFDEFFFPGETWELRRQLAWLDDRVADAAGEPVFCFLNVGETHVPYWHEGAPWDRGHNPCRPYADDNDAEECRRRQRACLEFVDAALGPFLQRFASANVVVCADHGDAWGEDGIWEHGVHHPAVLQVPLLYRLVRSPTSLSASQDPRGPGAA